MEGVTTYFRATSDANNGARGRGREMLIINFFSDQKFISGGL